MAGCMHLMTGSLKVGISFTGQRLNEGSKQMRFSWAVVVVVVGIIVSGFAQQNGTLKVKPSAPEKAPKPSAPLGKMPGSTTSSANAKELKAIEQQTARTPATSPSAGKKTSGKALALKPVKEKPNPPINFGATSGGRTAGTSHQGSSTYKGRLKQKGAGHQ
jgi:hypothetical protein